MVDTFFMCPHVLNPNQANINIGILSVESCTISDAHVSCIVYLSVRSFVRSFCAQRDREVKSIPACAEGWGFPVKWKVLLYLVLTLSESGLQKHHIRGLLNPDSSCWTKHHFVFLRKDNIVHTEDSSFGLSPSDISKRSPPTEFATYWQVPSEWWLVSWLIMAPAGVWIASCSFIRRVALLQQ